MFDVNGYHETITKIYIGLGRSLKSCVGMSSSCSSLLLSLQKGLLQAEKCQSLHVSGFLRTEALASFYSRYNGPPMSILDPLVCEANYSVWRLLIKTSEYSSGSLIVVVERSPTRGGSFDHGPARLITSSHSRRVHSHSCKGDRYSTACRRTLE
jgi:hypothetical protein